MGNELSSLFSTLSSSTRANALADFYDSTIEQFLGTSADVRTQLRACMINDEELYHLYGEAIQALIDQDDSKWDHYSRASKILLQYALIPCQSDLTETELAGLTSDEQTTAIADRARVKDAIARYQAWEEQTESDPNYFFNEIIARDNNQADVTTALTTLQTNWSVGNFDLAGDGYGAYLQIVRGKAADFADVEEIVNADGTTRRMVTDGSGNK